MASPPKEHVGDWGGYFTDMAAKLSEAVVGTFTPEDAADVGSPRPKVPEGDEVPPQDLDPPPVVEVEAVIMIAEAATHKDEASLQAGDRVLPPCLALQAEAQTSSTVESTAGELSSRSSHNSAGESVPASCPAASVETEDEKAGDTDLDRDAQGVAAVAVIKAEESVCELAEPQQRPRQPRASEEFLVKMLADIDAHLLQLRFHQQWMVGTVEHACRLAMKESFLSLTLVGSVALCVETPGSDVDVVCFTKPTASKGTVGSNLFKIREALQTMMSQSPRTHGLFSLNLIEDARVPILRVTWGLLGNTLAVDVLVDQRRPLDHVLWFQRIGAVPCPSAVTLTGAPAVMHITIVLRCVKWWVKRRKLPPTREGGLPTLAWLLLALHACSPLDESQKSMTQLVASLAAFFSSYAAFGALNGVLQFRGEEGKSEFTQKPARAQSPWAELSVLDPTLRSGDDNRELAPKLLPATQFLINYELGRAASLLPTGVMKEEDQEEVMRQLFEEVPEERNSLPSSSSSYFGAIMLLGDPAKGVGTLELANICKVHAHRDWKAPFLHRSDTRSEIHVKMQDVNMETRSCKERRRGDMVLCPCHFVCRVILERADRKGPLTVNAKDLARFKDMQRFLGEVQASHEATVDGQRAAESA